jgi:RND family efflux transporter MFP subunit
MVQKKNMTKSQHHDSSAHETHKEHKGARRGFGSLLIPLVVVVSVAGVALFLGLHRHSSLRHQAQERDQAQGEGRAVKVAGVTVSPTERDLRLIGETRAFYSVTLYPRVSGYMDQLLADIGDHVKKGQLLAHVESPEQEQAYLSAKANAFNLKRIAERSRILLKRKLISQQQADQAISQADVADSELKTQAVLRAYQDIVAPFDGIVSNRFVDPGNLMQNSSSSQAASQPMFTVTQADKLRIFAYIDQKYAPYVRAGDQVGIISASGKNFQTRIERVADELDPRTRTLLVESYLDNPANDILAGSYVDVQIKIKTPSFFEVPVQALVMKGDKPYVSVIDRNGTLQDAKIDLAENDGEHLLIRSGVKLGEKVALDVGTSVMPGQKVRVMPNQQAGQAQPSGSPGKDGAS